MNSNDFQFKTIFTCTCTHGGGGHMPACDFFVPTREQYAAVCRDRNDFAAYIDRNPGAPDHACVMCYPHGDAVVSGFMCVVHRARIYAPTTK